jgi:hypothetical protein
VVIAHLMAARTGMGQVQALGMNEVAPDVRLGETSSLATSSHSAAVLNASPMAAYVAKAISILVVLHNDLPKAKRISDWPGRSKRPKSCFCGSERVRIGVAATVKGEAPYLLEWIAYHRVVGIETFFIADNGGEDETSRLLRRLHRAGFITRHNVIGRLAPQQTVYNELVARMRALVDLVAVIDADEFIRPLDGDRVTPLIARYFVDPSVSALALHWANYGSARQTKWRRGLVLERFPYRAEQTFWRNTHVKSIARTDRLASCTHSHFSVLTHGRFIDTEGEDVVWNPRAEPGVSTRCSWRGVRLDHYAVKSLEEFITIRSPRGRSDLTPEQFPDPYDKGYFDLMDRNEVFDPARPSVIEGTKREMRRLRWRMTPAVQTLRKVAMMGK